MDTTVDFQLKVEDEKEYYFIHVTDTHTSNNKMSQEGLSQFVSEANSLSPDIRFVLNSGDLVNLSKSLDNEPATGHSWMAAYSGIMNNLEMPYYNVAGDHSDSSYRLDGFPRGDTRCGKPLFWEYLGPNLFSFEYGKIHFVSVDYANHPGKRQLNGKEYPTLQLQPDQVKWMTRDMIVRRNGTFVITTSEWDLMEHCEDFEKIAKANDIRLQLVGDSHTASYNDERVPYRIGGALSGCWWNKNTDLCSDLSQRGYFIYHVRGEEIDQFYKGLGRRVVTGELKADKAGEYSFPVEVSLLQKANLLSFRFTSDGDEMGISHLILKCGDMTYRDPLDEAIREVKSKHWGPGSVDWGAYIVGNGRLGENSFTFKRNTFLFVLK